MNHDLFFEKLFINSELKNDICRDLQMDPKEYTTLSYQLDQERKEEIQQIKRIRTLYNNKLKLEGFDLKPFNRFYKWYKNQHALQEGKCYYCKTEEHILAALFEKKFQDRKRTKRGKHLEVERRDAKGNKYDKDNCVLACYFCNNDKSDIFNEQEFMDYLKDRKGFFEKQYRMLDDKG